MRSKRTPVAGTQKNDTPILIGEADDAGTPSNNRCLSGFCRNRPACCIGVSARNTPCALFVLAAAAANCLGDHLSGPGWSARCRCPATRQANKKQENCWGPRGAAA